MLTSHILARLGVLGAVPALGAAVVLGAGTAHADNVITAPDHHMVKTLSDGTVVTMDLTDEVADVSPSLGGLTLHRNAMVSGHFHVHVDGKTVDPSLNLIFPGYTVGCSINISGGGGGGGTGLSGTGPGPLGTAAPATPAITDFPQTGSANLSLGPGQQRDFSLIDTEQPDNFGADSHYNYNQYSGNDWNFTYSDETIALTGCAGPSQARAFFTVQVNTANVRTAFTMYSEPFSLNL